MNTLQLVLEAMVEEAFKNNKWNEEHIEGSVEQVEMDLLHEHSLEIATASPAHQNVAKVAKAVANWEQATKLNGGFDK